MLFELDDLLENSGRFYWLLPIGVEESSNEFSTEHTDYTTTTLTEHSRQNPMADFLFRLEEMTPINETNDDDEEEVKEEMEWMEESQ